MSPSARSRSSLPSTGKAPGRPAPVGYLAPRPRATKDLDPHRTPLLTPAIAVDGVLIERGKVLLVRRRNPPFRNDWALPGGFVVRGERTEDAVVREVEEETGLLTGVVRLVGVYSDPSRDERGHVVSAAYRLEWRGGKLRGGSDARDARWWPLTRLPPLAFDHAQILREARRKSS